MLTKPTSWLALLSIGGIYFFKNIKNIRSHIIYAASIMPAIALSSLWLIKNKLIFNGWYGGPSYDSNTNRPFVIPANELFTQLKKLFEYFWEFPSLEKLTNLNTANLPFAQIINYDFLKTFYYYTNIAVFALISILIIFSIFWIITKYKKVSLFLFTIFLPITLFSVIYWPFFGAFNYWDGGRYSLPVFIFLITPLIIFLFNLIQIKKLKYIKFLIFSILILGLMLSVLNAFAIIITYRQQYKQFEILDYELEQKEIVRTYTNDNLTDILLRSDGYNSLISKETPTDCMQNEENQSWQSGEFSVCVEEDSAYIFKEFVSR